MKMRYKVLVFVAGTRLLYSMEERGIWNGKHYHENSDPQYKVAIKTLKGIQFTSADVVCDFGCGSGRVAAWLAKHYPSIQVFGCDSSKNMIEQACQTYAIIPNVKFEVADVQAEVSAIVVNVVYSFAALHWIKDKKAVFKLAAKKLVPGGLLIVRSAATTDNHPLLRAFERLKQDSKFREALDQQLHYFPYTVQEAQQLVKDAGLFEGDIRQEILPIKFENQEKLQAWFQAWFGGFSALAQLSEEGRNALVAAITQQYIAVLREDDENIIDEEKKSIKADGALMYYWPTILVKAIKPSYKRIDTHDHTL